MFPVAPERTDKHKHAGIQAEVLFSRLQEENTVGAWDGCDVSLPSIEIAPLKDGHTDPISILIQFREDTKLSWFWFELGVIPSTKWCQDAATDCVPNEMEWRFENYDELVKQHGLPYYMYVRTFNWETVVPPTLVWNATPFQTLKLLALSIRRKYGGEAGVYTGETEEMLGRISVNPPEFLPFTKDGYIAPIHHRVISCHGCGVVIKDFLYSRFEEVRLSQGGTGIILMEYLDDTYDIGVLKYNGHRNVIDEYCRVHETAIVGHKLPHRGGGGGNSGQRKKHRGCGWKKKGGKRDDWG